LRSISSPIDVSASAVQYRALSKGRHAALLGLELNKVMTRRTSMRSLIRPTLLAASLLIACGGIPGCSTDENSAGKMETGKMGGAMDKTDTGKMGGAMDKTDTGKMGGAMDKMETGKMGGAMDKMEKGKMQ
jgi:hypothetical protein